MSVAAARHLRLWQDERIAREILELSGSEPRWHGNDRRFRSIRGMVEKGDGIWASLGAWPWAAFEDGHPPAGWWELSEPVDALRKALGERSDSLREKLEKAEGLSAWLDAADGRS